VQTLHLFTAAATAAPDPGVGASRALVMFLILGAGLALFLLLIVVLSIVRRRTIDAERSRADAASLELDAWRAAGERVDPIDAGGPKEPGASA